VYVHRNGFASSRLQYAMKSRILAPRASVDAQCVRWFHRRPTLGRPEHDLDPLSDAALDRARPIEALKHRPLAGEQLQPRSFTSHGPILILAIRGASSWHFRQRRLVPWKRSDLQKSREPHGVHHRRPSANAGHGDLWQKSRIQGTSSLRAKGPGMNKSIGDRRRGAPMARREEGAASPAVTDEQRSQRGWIGVEND